MSLPVQLALFGPQPVHIASGRNCALCRVSLGLAGAWDRMEGCHQCPGLVEPAPPWAVLDRAETAAEPLPLVAANQAA